MKLITKWETYNHKEKIWEHNHIEDGWVFGYIPKAKKIYEKVLPALTIRYPEQTKNWKNKTWRKSFMILIDNKVEPHDHYCMKG
jgi:hypothetical protein